MIQIPPKWTGETFTNLQQLLTGDLDLDGMRVCAGELVCPQCARAVIETAGSGNWL